MNKIQYIKLLELRGVTELNGTTMAEAVRTSGGDPTVEEMVKVNQLSMEYYIDKCTQYEQDITKLTSIVTKLERRDRWLRCLESAGVDNWEGYDYASDLMEEGRD